jgi:hypothetical protein
VTLRQGLTIFDLAGGALSTASGVALVLAPRPVARVYGLPDGRVVVVLLGVRDVAIGLGLAIGRAKRGWWIARAISDGFDAILIAAGPRKQSSLATAGRVAAALGLAIASSLVARSHAPG